MSNKLTISILALVASTGLAFAQGAGGRPHHRLGHLHRQAHVGQHVLDGLERADGPAEGQHLARDLVGDGHKVFLDMKLLDIGNTVERATRAAAATGATFLTVHGHDTKTLRAAVAGRAGTGLKILAVTVLTSLDANDLAEQGIAASPQELVVRRARLAQDAGCDGIVASGLEAAHIRAAVGPDAAGDQARVSTPQSAIAAGADYLVVGRPITAAGNPRQAAETFVVSIEEALAMRALGPQG